MATKQISLRLDEELLARIDAQADDVPRERFLRRIIEARIDEMEGVDRFVRLPPVAAQRQHSPTCKCAVCAPKGKR